MKSEIAKSSLFYLNKFEEKKGIFGIFAVRPRIKAMMVVANVDNLQESYENYTCLVCWRLVQQEDLS